MGGRPGVQIPVVSWRRKRVATVPEMSSLFGQIDEQLPFTPAVPGYFCRLGRTQLICAAAEKFVGSFATWWFHLGNCYGQTVPKLDCHEARRIIFEGKNICSLERAKKKNYRLLLSDGVWRVEVFINAALFIWIIRDWWLCLHTKYGEDLEDPQVKHRHRNARRTSVAMRKQC
jgi:hypothetical protein